MFFPTCITALLLMFSVHGNEVVARLNFSHPIYVLKESKQICVEVINAIPSPDPFRVNYMYSTVLTGMSDIHQEKRQDSFSFRANSARAQLCIDHAVDERICEGDISGTIELLSNPIVALGDPHSARVTVQDNDTVSVSFTKRIFELNEGSGINAGPIVNATFASSVVVEISTAPATSGDEAIERSLSYSTPIMLTLDNITKRVPLELTDDSIALEDSEDVNLSLRVYSESPCGNANLSPFMTTTLFIHDNDVVHAEVTETSGTVREGESHEVCITLSHEVARKLNFTVQIQSGTATLDDLEGSAPDLTFVTFLPRAERMKCVTITAAEDNVIEEDEVFTVQVQLQTNLPDNIRDNIELGSLTTFITIQDRSSCTEYPLTPTVTPSAIYVHQNRALCFFCSMCSSQMAWNVTSHRGRIWTGTSGQLLQSSNSIPDRGTVHANGTLVLRNSSVVFSKVTPAKVKFRELQGLQPLSSEYEVYLGEKAAVTELLYSFTDNAQRLTCHFTGSPPPQVEWLSDSQTPVNEDAVLRQTDSETESVLVIDPKIAKDLNEVSYTCRVSNMFGSDSSNTRLPVDPEALNNHANLLHYPAYLLLISLLLSQL